MKKYIPIIIILIGMAAIYFSGVYRLLSFEALKSWHVALKSFLQMHPVSMPVFYMLAYITITALSVPGAIFLTLLGGYLFPQPYCTLYVIFAATCGATLIFLAARTALQGLLKKRARPFLKKMEKGFNNDAASYMLFLRLTPFVPYWIVNLAPAFFRVPLRTYVWTTVIGIIPATVIFTLVGSGLEKMFEKNEEFSITALFNLHLIIAMVLLGTLALVPVFIKRYRKT